MGTVMAVASLAMTYNSLLSLSSRESRDVEIDVFGALTILC